MKTFEANRLSGGNRLFPAEIKIDDFGVTVKIPGVFSGKEKTLGYHEISSIKIDSPMIGFSKITFDTIGWNRLIAEGFEKSQAEEIRSLVQTGIQSTRFNGGGTNTVSVSIAQAEVEKARLELEERKMREEKEVREASERKEKGARFREEGKPLTAFLVELNPAYLAFVGLAYVMALFLIANNTRGVTKIVSIGLLAIIGVIFLGLVVKDFFKLSKKTGAIITLSLCIVPVVISTWKIIDKTHRPSHSEMIQMAAEDQKLLEQLSEPDAVKTENESVQEKPANELIEKSSFIESSKGEWKGAFGKNELTLVIESINDDGSVTGYNIVKGNRRNLTGTYTEQDNGLTIELSEPGDEEWDGVFKFKTDGREAKGEWIANNGKSKKKFVLTK